MTSKSLPPAPPRTHAMLGDYDSMKNNYLAMLSSSQEAMRNIERLTASPEFQSLGDHFPEDFPSDSPYAGEPLIDEDFLTSPHMELDYDFATNNPNASPLDTPYSAFLPTPLMGLEGDDFDQPVISPEVEDALAGELFAFTDNGEDAVPVNTKLPLPPNGLGLGKLGAFTPSTPMLDDFDSPLTDLATSFPNTPVIPPPPSPSSSTHPTRRQPARKTRVVLGANGTRKNITPAALIPIDAPTQHRTYRIPSTTSRKAVPASSSRKRGRSVAFADEDDEDDDDYASDGGRGPVSVGEAQRIMDKRRQNTLAARKSRRRKLEHVQGLEAQVSELKGLVTRWRERALMAQGMLRDKGETIEFGED